MENLLNVLQAANLISQVKLDSELDAAVILANKSIENIYHTIKHIYLFHTFVCLLLNSCNLLQLQLGQQ